MNGVTSGGWHGQAQSAAADEARPWRARCAPWLITLALFLAVAKASVAGSLVPKGQPAPEFALNTLDAQGVSLSELRGRIVLLVFGELYNRNSVEACQELAKVLADGPPASPAPAAYLVVSQDAPAEELADAARRQDVTLPILHDVRRRTFAAYNVMVLPSLLVLDARGTVVLPCAGYPLDFEAMVADAILLAAGGLSDTQFDLRRNLISSPALSEAQSRAVRLVSLGEELARRGSRELALSQFREALTLDPGCTAARLGLGKTFLARGDLALAEEQFQHVLAASPESVEGAVGLIRVQIIRGGDELRVADEQLRALLRKLPNDPKLVYLAGLVAEQSGDSGAALGRYKKAAEALLFGSESAENPE